jgi:hypothetical protein
MYKNYALSLVLTLGINIINAQSLQSIATDRPDQTESPFIVPKGFFQAENGFLYEKSSVNSQSIAYPSILWKYGLNDNFEFRLITELVNRKENAENQKGISPVKVGFKVKITDEKGLIPKTSFIGHIAIPNIAAKTLRIPYYAPLFRLTMQHTITERFALAYNLGAEWDGITPEPTFIYTLTTGFGISEKLGSYLELYGFSPQNQQSDHRFDGGFTYLINKNVMMDISGGLGISSNPPNYFISLGFSYRFKIKN